MAEHVANMLKHASNMLVNKPQNRDLNCSGACFQHVLAMFCHVLVMLLSVLFHVTKTRQTNIGEHDFNIGLTTQQG